MSVELGRELATIERRLSALERARSLANSSLDDAHLPVYDTDGTLRQRIGKQTDGTYTVTDENAAPPPVAPAAPGVEGRAGLLVVTSYGTTADGSDWPKDFARLAVHVSATSGFTPTAATKVAEFTAHGGSVAVALNAGTYYAVIVAVNTSGAQSAPSAEMSAAVQPPATGSGGVKTYDAATAPTGLSSTDAGALWFDTSDGNHQYRWDGITWVSVQDSAIGQAQTTADGKNSVFYNNVTKGDPTPTATATNDLWMKPDEDYRPYRWDGSTWAATAFGSAALADGAVTGVKIAAQAVDVNKLADGSVSAAKLVDAAVTPAKASFYGEVTTAQSTADTAKTNAATAQTSADNAQTAANAAQSAADAADTKATNAQTAASQAQSDAAAANQQALDAANIANSKGTVYHQSAAPAGDANGLWIDSANGNVAKTWDGTSWVVSQDADIQAAASAAATADDKAVAAQSKADQAATDAATAQTAADAADTKATNAQAAADAAQGAADTAQQTADGKNTVFYNNVTAGDPAPTATAADDLWFKPDQDYQGFRWDGAAWSAMTFGTAALSDGAVTTTKIGDAQVDLAKLADGSVDATKIIAGAVGTTALADAAVDSVKIADGAVVAGKVAADAITANEIAAGAIGTNELAANAVTAGTIAANAITTAKINAGAVTATQIAANAVTAAKINAGAVTAGKIGANAVTAGKINAGAVTAGTVAAGVIGADQLAANAVVAGKIDAAAVTAGTIAANAVDTAELAANAVTAGIIAAGAVTADKLEANLVLGSRIIAGTAAGARAEMNSTTGFEAYDTNGVRTFLADKTGTVAVTGAVQSTDYAEATTGWRLDSNQAQTTNLNVISNMGADTVTARTISVDGQDLTGDVIPSLSQGAVAYGQVYDGLSKNIGPGNTNGMRVYTFAVADLDDSRIYALHWHVTMNFGGTADMGAVRLTYETDGSTPTDYSPVLPGTENRFIASNNPNNRYGPTVNCMTVYRPPAGTDQVKFAICVEAFDGSLQVKSNTAVTKAELYMLDLGAKSNAINSITQNNLDTGGDGGTPQSTYTKTYYPTWTQSYDGDGSKRAGGDGGNCYQGYYSGTHGRTTSLVGYDWSKIQNDLAGATIESVKLVTRARHSYYGAGMDVVVHQHNNGSEPATFSDGGELARKNNVTAGETATIDLGTTFGNHLRDGTMKGVAFDSYYSGMPDSSTGRNFYGYLYGAGSGSAPKLKVTFQK